MPNLKPSIRWQRYEPDLPGNRKTKDSHDTHRPFFFELAGDLTKEQLRGLQAGYAALQDEPEAPKGETQEQATARVIAWEDGVFKQTAAMFEPFIRFGTEPLNFDGEPIKTLEEYLRAVSKFASSAAAVEPIEALRLANTLYGVQGFFSERLSGGFASTR